MNQSQQQKLVPRVGFGLAAILLLAAVVDLHGQEARPEPLALRLEGSAEAMTLPPADGANRFLTVSVLGGPPDEVWLARSADAAARVALTPVGRERYQVNLLSAEVVQLVGVGGGELRVYAKIAGGEVAASVALRYAARPDPRRLTFPWDSARFTVYQRSSLDFPGSERKLRLHVGDIAGGQVPVSVYQENHRPLVTRTSLEPGQTLRLSLEDEEYVVVLEQLVNLLVGRDYAVFRVTTAEQWQRDEIERILVLIEGSGGTFLRSDGLEWGARDYALHLRQKVALAPQPEASVEQFIDRVAGESWLTKEPYRVRLAGGEIRTVSQWLREAGGVR